MKNSVNKIKFLLIAWFFLCASYGFAAPVDQGIIAMRYQNTNDPINNIWYEKHYKNPNKKSHVLSSPNLY